MRLKYFCFVLGCICVLALACSDSAGPGEDDTPKFPPPTPVALEYPPGYPIYVDPPGNPLTREGIELGRHLFYDPILSGDSTQSCGDCHAQANAFGDPRQFSVGIDGSEGNRNAPTIINPALLPVAFWDGREPSLEDQARRPVENKIEMNLPWAEAIPRLEAHPTYPAMFGRAFGDESITQDRVVKAIAQFERTFVSLNSKFDRRRRGEVAFTEIELRGFGIFFGERGDCFHCHNGFLGTDNLFHNIGLPPDPRFNDTGRFDVTGDPIDDKSFKTPTLRNIAVSAPYMHDGRFATLEDVVGHYNLNFDTTQTNLDPLIRARGGRPPLTAAEIDTLVTFLHTFTDQSFLTNPDLANPFAEK